MLRTEDEARKCWCPFARLAENRWNTLDDAFNKSGAVLCIASECMAWRFLDFLNEDDVAYRITERGVNFRRAERMDDPAKLRGFCGLSGQP